MFHVKLRFPTNQKVVGSNPAGRAKENLEKSRFFLFPVCYSKLI